MEKELIYKSKVDRVFYPDGLEFLLTNKGISINIKGDRDLAKEEPIAFYYGEPYFNLLLKVKDLNIDRKFIDFNEEVNNILRSFSKWLSDVKGVKITQPIFDKGYINNKEVNSFGKRILGSGSVTLYQFPIKEEVDANEIKGIFQEIDDSNEELAYLKNSEKYFEKRREILLSKDTVGGFISLYAFLQDRINASNQKAVDDYIRKVPFYDIKNDRKTTKPDRDHQETIFTWLRNQIGHMDPNNVEYTKVTTEIRNWYEVLYEITFIALQEL